MNVLGIEVRDIKLVDIPAYHVRPYDSLGEGRTVTGVIVRHGLTRIRFAETSQELHLTGHETVRVARPEFT